MWHCFRNYERGKTEGLWSLVSQYQRIAEARQCVEKSAHLKGGHESLLSEARKVKLALQWGP